jgi:acetyl/propionyl-CoA carboxylase alpha subunit
MFVREADEGVTMGEQSPYLDHSELERAPHASGADAAWVGWGFVTEDPAFARLPGRRSASRASERRAHGSDDRAAEGDGGD